MVAYLLSFLRLPGRKLGKGTLSFFLVAEHKCHNVLSAILSVIIRILEDLLVLVLNQFEYFRREKQKEGEKNHYPVN